MMLRSILTALLVSCLSAPLSAQESETGRVPFTILAVAALSLPEPIPGGSLFGPAERSAEVVLLRVDVANPTGLLTPGALPTPIWMLDDKPARLVGTSLEAPVFLAARPKDLQQARLWLFDPNPALSQKDGGADSVRKELARQLAIVRESAAGQPVGDAFGKAAAKRMPMDELEDFVDSFRELHPPGRR